MTFSRPDCDIFIPDGITPEKALSRTTHMGIGAHQDDLEIMAYDGALTCFGREDLWYAGVVVTNGAGSPRDGIYASYSDEEMQKVRIMEQRKAAYVGEYSACVQFKHPSGAVKNPLEKAPAEDIASIVKLAKPTVIYTHNLSDKHDTHVAVALRVIAALRSLPKDERPERLFGCEVWRGLDWLCDDEKVVFNVSERPNIAASLVGVFDSQVAGGKRYDLAAAGRRTANATFLASHFVDNVSSAIYGVDMTALIHDDNLDPLEFYMGYIKKFSDEVSERIGKFK